MTAVLRRPPRTYDLAGADHDVDTGPGQPASSYVLCSTPRSGSTLLSEALHATGRVGTPIEYLDDTDALAQLWLRWGCRSFGQYLDRLHRYRCTPEGRFGVKVHWEHVPVLVGRLREEGLLPRGRRPELAALDVLAPRRRHVVVRRRDRLGQAVSWFVARHTDRWSSLERAEVPPPRYDRAGIDACLADLDEADRRWSELLAPLGDDVLDVDYEDLVADYPATVRRVLHHVGVPGAARVEVPPPRLRRQSDGHNEELRARYLAGC